MVAENSLVAIRTATNMCFGVVIASRFVLFAADCITEDDIQLDDLNLSAGRENIEAHAIHKSPQHPIAMIQLKYDRDISMCIEPRIVFKDSYIVLTREKVLQSTFSKFLVPKLLIYGP